MTKMKPTDYQESLGALPLSQIRKELYSSPARAYFESATQDRLQALQARCDAHWTQKISLFADSFLDLFLFSLTALGLITCAVFFLYPGQIPLNSTLDGALARVLIGGNGTLIVVSLVLAFFIDLNAAHWLSDALKPLKTIKGGHNKELLKLKSSHDAKAYCDNVLQSGRELRMIDLLIMKGLMQAQRNGP